MLENNILKHSYYVNRMRYDCLMRGKYSVPIGSEKVR